MGGRGSSSGFSNNRSDKYSGDGPGKDSPYYAMTETNPNFSTGTKAYTQNCQRCVYAYELNRRGVDCEATAKLEHNDEFAPNWRNVMKGQTWSSVGSTSRDKVVRNIEQQMQSYGEGARAVIYVAWNNKEKTAHVFNAEYINGSVHYIDAQVGDVVNIKNTINAARPTKTYISRVDNLEPNDIIEKAIIRR